jgi:hypothetical protein
MRLEQIRITSPCEVPWDTMRGGDRVRFCKSCRQNVYNVEAMTRAEAERLIAAREGRACLRMLWRPDGTVVTADCWARLRAARLRGLIPFVATLLVVGWAQLAAMRFGLRAWQSRSRTGAPAPVNAPPTPAVRPTPLPVPAGPLMGPPPPVERLTGKPAIPVRKMGEAGSWAASPTARRNLA